MPSTLAATFACMILVGAVVALWQRLPWLLSQRLKVPEPMCRDWQSWFSFPLIFLFPLLGHLIDGWDGQFVLFVGILCLAVSLAWLGQHRTVGSGLGALLLMCVAIPLVALPTFGLLPTAVQAAMKEVKPIKHVLALNVAFTGVILGMMLTPSLVDLFVKRFDARRAFLFLALLCLVPALFVSLTPLPAVPREPTLAAILHDGRCWMLAALAFVYYMLAELFGMWKNGFLQQSAQGKPWIGMAFWLTALVGLPITGWAVWDRFEAWGLAVLALALAVVVGNLAGDFTTKGGTLSLWLAGGIFAPFLPVLLTIPARTFHDDPAGAMGLALGGGALGNFLMQPMLERFAQRNTVTASMWLSTILSLGFGALALVLALMLNLSASH